MSKVFVSYKRADKDKVFHLVHEMESEFGIEFWMDLEGIESYDQFSKRIIKAINECEVFLFIYSKAHENIDPENDWTVKELNFAYGKKKRIVWIELEECSLHDWFLFNFPQRQVTQANDRRAMNKLMKDIRKLLHLPQPNLSPNDQGKTIDTKGTHISMPNRQSKKPEKINPHPQAIDLGLPSGTKWASCNVGASKPEECGGYFAWGETEEKDIYDWSTYKHCDDWASCDDLGSDIAGTKYDVAHMKWGGNWRMPTFEQIEELLDNCDTEQTEINSVRGRKFTSKINGYSIFLPAAGGRYGSDLSGAGSNGGYWSSTQYPSNSNNAYGLAVNLGYAGWFHTGRHFGYIVRPVSRI